MSLTSFSMSTSPINVTSAGTQFAPTSLEQNVLLAFMGSVMVDVILYGIYLVLFCICMYILVRNGRSTHWFIPTSAFLMFALSTVDIAISFNMIVHNFFAILQANNFLFYAQTVYPKSPIIAVVNNFIAELILLYRCYMIWGRSKYLLVGASLLVLGDLILGLYALLSSQHFRYVMIYRWSLFIINIALTAVIVGRILWVSRIARPAVDCQSFRHYRIIVAILIETNVIYSGCLLGSLLFPVGSPNAIIIGRISVRLVAIMPTLLIVQIGLGRIIREAEITVPRETTVVLDSVVSTCLNAEEGTAIPVSVHPRTVRTVDEDQHGIFVSDTMNPPYRQ